ncbi:MAG: hypothetical protein RL654_3225 [Pseudomonadota bacterium]
MFPMLARWLRRAPRPRLPPNLSPNLATDLAPALERAVDATMCDRRRLPPQAIRHHPIDTTDERIHLQIDPQDPRRVRISGSMREVCAALDALVAVQ